MAPSLSTGNGVFRLISCLALDWGLITVITDIRTYHWQAGFELEDAVLVSKVVLPPISSQLKETDAESECADEY
jgi:hypothetical protein